MNRRILTLLITAWLILSGGNAFAWLDYPGSWKIELNDERYVLVMVSSQPMATDIAEDEEWKAQEIRAKYTQSGLYLNDSSADPLWPVEYRYETWAVHLSSDGRYLVINDSNGSWERLSFYDKGKRLAFYDETDLDPYFYPKLIAGRIFGFGGGAWGFYPEEFDPEKLTYQVESRNEQFTLDVTTGQVIEHWSLWPLYFGLPLVVFPLAMIRYSRRRKRKARARRGWLQFSLLNLLVTVTMVGVTLELLRNDMGPLVSCLAPSVVGGTIVWLWEKTREAWPIGILMTLYGGFVGFVIWALLGSIDNDYFYGPSGLAGPLLIACPILGTLTGLVSAFMLLRRYRASAIEAENSQPASPLV